MSAVETTRNKESAVTGGLVAAMVLLCTALFQFHGNTTDAVNFGHSLFRVLFSKWNDPQGSMSHGWLIPLIALYFVWDRRAAHAAAPKQVWWWGLIIVVASLALHWVGLRVQQSRLSMFAIIGLCWSIPALVYGRAVGKRLLFPCAYLLLAVPWHFLDTMTFPLRLMATTVSGWLLNGLGFATVRIGTALYSEQGGGFAVDVADPCSGLRSLLAIVALSTAYAYLSKRTTTQRALLCLLAVPLVLLANVCRIVTTAIGFSFTDSERLHRWLHDGSGYLVFGFAVILLMALDAILVRAGKWNPREWKNNVTKHS